MKIFNIFVLVLFFVAIAMVHAAPAGGKDEGKDGDKGKKEGGNEKDGKESKENKNEDNKKQSSPMMG